MKWVMSPKVRLRQLFTFLQHCDLCGRGGDLFSLLVCDKCYRNICFGRDRCLAFSNTKRCKDLRELFKCPVCHQGEDHNATMPDQVCLNSWYISIRVWTDQLPGILPSTKWQQWWHEHWQHGHILPHTQFRITSESAWQCTTGFTIGASWKRHCSP